MAERTWRSLGAHELPISPSSDPEVSRARLLEARLVGPEQEQFRTRALELLDRHGVDLADRRTAPGHLTGSALVIDHERERVVVLLHTKLRRWLQPGGHADGDHDLAAVALREAQEETGLAGLRVLVPAVDLDIHELDHGDDLGAHLHLDLRFVVLAPPGAQLEGNHESLDIAWVDLAALERLADEDGLVRLARAGLAAVREPGVS